MENSQDFSLDKLITYLERVPVQKDESDYGNTSMGGRSLYKSQTHLNRRSISQQRSNTKLRVTEDPFF
jgi:hypothetical protein